jgi:hypothetical protein
MATFITPHGQVAVDKYVDFNYKGFQSSISLNQKFPFLLQGIEAIKNVIKIYLMSQRGDYGRNLAKGGPVMVAIGKRLSDANVEQVKTIVKDAIAIYSNIVVNEVIVTADIENKGWIIKINFSDTYNKVTDNINLSIVQQG